MQGTPVMSALLRLQELFALHEIELKLGEFTLDGYFSAAQVHNIHVKVWCAVPMQ